MVRTAEASWEGSVARGQGTIVARSSGAFALPYSLATRIGSPEGKTSPEELVAAAHAGCFAMSLASELTQLGHPPERLEVEATCVMDEVEGRGHLVVSSELQARARVPGLAEEAFRRAVERADAGCALSSLIRGSAQVKVEASLEA
ncbi:MAG: osmotically inducible protein OsmC [Thermoleophilia bacterium]